MDTQSTQDATQTKETAIQSSTNEKNTFLGPDKPYRAHNILKEDLTSWTSKPKEEAAPQETVEDSSEEATPQSDKVEEPTASQVQKDGEESREESDRLRKAFSEITRREKELRAREKKMQERLEKMESKYEAYDKADDPIKALQAKGYTYDDAVKAVLHQKDENLKKDPYVEKLEEKLSSVQEKLESFEKTNQEKEDQKKVDEFQGKISSHINDAGTKYELLKNYGMEEAVFETIVKTHEEEGRKLGIDEACILVENELEKSLKSQFETLKNLEKTRNWFGDKPTSQENSTDDNSSESGSPAERAVQEVKDAQDQSQGSTKTLTNKMQSPEEMALQKRRLNRDDSVKNAASRLIWE